MAKVYGIHEIELHPGADPAAFEQLFADGAKLDAGYEGDALPPQRRTQR